MRRIPFFLRWLALAALTDWLVTRTLARAAIFMPKSPPVLTAYQVVVAAGQVASVLAALLALAGMLWLAVQFGRALPARAGYRGALSLVLLALVCISLVVQVIVPGAFLQLAYHALILGVVLWTLIHTLQGEAIVAQKVAVMMAGMALLAGGLFQAIQVLSQVLGWSNPPEFTLTLFNLGEVLAVLSPVAVWWAQRFSGSSTAGQLERSSGSSTAGHRAETSNASYQMESSTARQWWLRSSTYLWAAIPALGFSVLALVNPAMTGILAIWSTGLTLFLPWPIYALSLWLVGAIVIASWRSGEPAGWALLLLAAGGYAPQLSSQVFFSLIGLILLSWAIPLATRVDSTIQIVPLASHAVETR